MVFHKGKVLLIVTGASRGLGRALTECFCDRFIASHSEVTKNENAMLTLLLLARNAQLLSEVRATIESKSPQINVFDALVGDLSLESTQDAFEKSLQKINDEFDEAIIIHNAGTVGDPNQLVDSFTLQDSQFIKSYFECNVFSVIKMTSAFLRKFASKAKHCTIVNISSLAAVKAIKGLSIYGAGKAARDAYFRSVALEMENTSVLNYAPGPLQTEMVDILKKEGFNKEFFKEEKNLLKPESTIKKLFNLLETGNYENGSHVDVFDIQ
ncbi:sepiapterin reductase-like protein [Dinothrombium tinctorium]|uniref:Sepiapterin reductase-like protein n=1 Tax=Dinothrombium tinctorium TaxID=1965070 RepID=A0A443R8H9_9ACAR|nr:sepiapterin reductase-like protein [Dinothrombium tinctorium]